MEIKVGDIINYGSQYMRVVKTGMRGGSVEYTGEVTNSLYKFICPTKGVKFPRKSWNSSSRVVRTVDGKVIPEFEKMQKLSRREQIIYLANKYRKDLLTSDFLKKKEHYTKMAQDIGITQGELYRYISLKLRFNNLSSYFNEWQYHAWGHMSEENQKEIIKLRENKLKEVATFGLRDVWLLLAYYCEYHSIKDAKSALSRFEKLFYAKDWDRIKEMWTPLFYPDYNFLQSSLMVCKIIKRRQGKEYVYEAELLDDGMKDQYIHNGSVIGLNKEKYLNRTAIVIAKDKDKERIDYLLNQGSTVKIVGKKEKPFRNKTSDILKITTMRAR